EPTHNYDEFLAAFLQRLENAGYSIPTDTDFLNDAFAVQIMNAVLGDLELAKQQRNTSLMSLARSGKRRATTPEEAASEPKKTRLQENKTKEIRPIHPGKYSFTLPAKAVNPTVESVTVPTAPASMRASSDAPIASSSRMPPPPVPVEVVHRPPTPQSRHRDNNPPQHRGLESSRHAPPQAPVQPSSSKKRPPRKKPDESTLVAFPFPSGLPLHAGAATMFFHPPLVVPAPPEYYPVVTVMPDPRTDNQIAGILSSPVSEDDDGFEDAPDNEHTRQMARNRQEDITGRIPDLLGVRSLGGTQVERLNSFFSGSLGRHFYYSSRINTCGSMMKSPLMASPSPKTKSTGFPLEDSLLLVISTGNPRVFFVGPVPIPAETLTRNPRVFPVNHEPKTVSNGRQTVAGMAIGTRTRTRNPHGFPNPCCSLPVTPLQFRRLYCLAVDQYRSRYEQYLAFQLVAEFRRIANNIAPEHRDLTMTRALDMEEFPSLSNPSTLAEERRWLVTLDLPPGLTLPPRRRTRSSYPDNERQNFGATEALRILLRNRIPPEWIDHAYPYGVAYLDQHFFGQSQLIDTFTEIDDERIARLQQYGTPPAIAAWDGWREITTDERYMIYAQHSEDDFFERPPAEHNGFYYPIGADILRERLPIPPHNRLILHQKQRIRLT
ncbi:hypothetical protein H0H93_010079, partial [Arthromyces matolae]